MKTIRPPAPPAPSLLALAFAAAALAGLLVLAIAGWTARHAGERQQLVAHTMEVRRAIALLEGRLARADAAALQWLVWPEAGEAAEPHASPALLEAEVREQLDGIARLTADNPLQQGRIALLRDQVDGWLAGLDALRAEAEVAADRRLPASDIRLLAGRQRVAGAAIATLRELDAEEARLLVVRAAAWDESAVVLRGAFVAATLVTVLVLALALRLRRRERERRRAEHARALSEADALSRSNLELSEAVFARSDSLHRSREALVEANARLRRLSRELLQVQENERAALARELHDDLGQQLGALRIGIELLALDAPGEAERARLRETAAVAAGCISLIRERAMALRPPLLDELGLAAALRWHAERQTLLTGAAIDTEVELPGLEPNDEWALHVYRIAQEAIGNALRHGGAGHIRLRLDAGADAVRLDITDDGRGFDIGTGAAGMGLRNMRERVELLDGNWHVVSTPGRGTRVEARWPRAVVTARPDAGGAG
ncbi:ATP-binding protein [Derxia gummosa]|uniref:ATP-binding protein n=1 Tax=Derxia gummosa DSM 723 TaxID=1121388 RepID=A0A8B6X371_9BURK|nr:ATP-binding protein [Derxia gummosa]